MIRENGNTLRREDEALAELRKGEKLAGTLAALLGVYRGDAAELCRFLLFALAGEALPRAERLVGTAALLKTAEEHALPGYARAAWEAEKRRGECVPLYFDLMVREMDARELEAHALKLAGESTNNRMVEEVERKMAQASHSTERLHYDLVCMGEGERIDEALELYGSALRDASEFGAEALLPLPSTVEVDAAQLLTPFPLVVEAPALSPAFDAAALLTGILDRAGTADANMSAVS